ncbi:6-hydroxynicotinate 3-monooxygenase [Cladophialophora carrionii]|uniref:6-hydroxynicotinate 3-monooxygenase n=1 Tax=Cladophialophora carrionii TaxID=86049 RepID=A0A1C1CSS4_9EURO|nr:6-hydroxynicotinate 3-monooxygenase [Cladophialophora carrionii]
MASIQIVIVGAGIAGLATAISISQKTKHGILILESSPVLTEAGAGVQINASASRLLSTWGLKERFEAVATRPDFLEIRRYDDFELLGLIPSNVKSYSERVRGSPHWLVHRVDYQRILADAAMARGVKIRFGQKLADIDIENVTIMLADGSTLRADLIIGADGIHSRVRRSIPALTKIVPRRTENFCYRALIPRETMMQNASTRGLIENRNQQAWAGQDTHIIAYPIANGRLYNLVMMVPDQGEAPLGKYNEPGDVTDMRKVFKGYNDTVKAVLDAVDSCAKWVIAELPPLPRWSSENGRVILVGDACHAMSPHAASGATASLEDAEVLGLCLATCQGVEDLPRAAADYEHLRKPRCERIQEISRENGTTFSLPDGPAQRARDQAWLAHRMALEKQLAEDAPLLVPEEDMTKQYPHPSVVQWLVGHNITEEAEAYLRRQS